jgi:hypothetical protein
MTDYDPLESELAALRPHQPSAELKRRIAGSLAEGSLRPKTENSSLWRGAALVGGLLAASLAAVLVWQGGNQRFLPEPIEMTDHIAFDFDESLPSLWSYRAAMRHSPGSLETLFDKHAEQTLAHKSGGAPAFVFARSNLTNDSWLGEL